MATFPLWLHVLSIASLALAALCGVVVAFDETRRHQPMWIMNLVWPLCALFGSVIWLAFYWRHGRGLPPKQDDMAAMTREMGQDTSMPIAVAKGASHCGAGCTLGDIVAEGLAFIVPSIAVAFGWRSLFREKMFAVWVFDFFLAFLLGVAFQYFTITPMRSLSPGEGIVAALKADAASITAWQVGMFGFMAVAQLGWFRPVYGGIASANQPEFWFAMQIAMLFGFATSYPMNWVLVKAGVKEKM